MNGLVGASVAWLAACRDLLLPRGCAGCDAPDETLCPACLPFFGALRSWRLPGTSFPCHACADYRGPVRQAVLAWKDHGDVELDRVFARIMERAVEDAVRAGGVPASRGSLLVVPLPSSARSVRRRGRVHVRPLARAVGGALAWCGVDARVVDALTVRGVRSKSVEASDVRSRRRRLSDGVVCRDAEALRGCDVVLVDDIVTTGSTVAQCARVVEGAGGRVVAAFALAHTPRPGAVAGCGSFPTPRGTSAG